MARRQQIVVIVGSLLALVLIVGLLVSSGTTVKAPTPTAVAAVATPTGARPDCGRVLDARAGAAFPVINTQNCPPDPTVLARKAWNSISVRLPLSGSVATTCEDWYAFHTNQTGNWEIFRLDKGSKMTNLSRGGDTSNNISPSMSPDRKTMAFTSDRDGNWEIYTTTTDGSGEPQRITYNTFAVDMGPVWSPDGKMLVYDSIRKGNWDLYLFDVVAGQEYQLTDSPADDTFPAWTTDSKTVIYQTGGQGKNQIMAIDVDSLKAKALSDGKGEDSAPVMSPDGTRIAFLSQREGAAHASLYLMNADGSNLTPIALPDMVIANQSFSPNGNLLAFQGAKPGEKSSVFVYDLTQKEMRQVTAPTVASYAPTWDCSSSTLVFTADITNPNLFSAPALPMTAPPVDVSKQAMPLTEGRASSQFPVGATREENASKLTLAAAISAGG
jgi:hypothetical protein